MKQMNDDAKKPTRKGSAPIKVYCLPEEKARIERQARDAGMSAARFLREVGQGYPIKGIVDLEQVRELARINGDLGRIGGLLKLWLTDDKRTAQFGESVIRAALASLEDKAEKLAVVMGRIVRPRATRFL